MRVAVPTEVKNHEYRVGLVPSSVAELVHHGHEVVVEAGAGIGSGIPDADYVAAGATLLDSADAVFAQADMIVKVKEPQLSECVLFRPGQVLFTYLHLASLPDLTKALVAADITAIAYETVEARDHSLPVLRPMSEIAGRLAVQIGAHYLGTVQGGRGLLLAGVPGVPPAHVVVLGAGVVGTSAVRIAVGMGARVTVINLDLDQLRFLDDLYGGRLATCAATESALERAVVDAGRKSIGCEYGPPRAIGIDASVCSVSEEHCVLAGHAVNTLTRGQVIRLRPSQIRTTFNLHDSVWLKDGQGLYVSAPVAARGAST